MLELTLSMKILYFNKASNDASLSFQLGCFKASTKIDIPVSCTVNLQLALALKAFCSPADNDDDDDDDENDPKFNLT